MTKRESHKRLTALCSAALGIFLWSISVNAALFASFQGQASVTRRNQKPAATTPKSNVLVEQFSFVLKDFKMDHQGENNNLNITIRYRYKADVLNTEYPDFRLLAKDIETLLTNYPNEDDYWEILNKKLTSIILEKYPVITRITSQIQVSPSGKVPYLRSSIVTRERTTMSKHPSSSRSVK